MDPAIRMGIAVSTVFAVGFVALVWKFPRVARWLTGVGFLAASGVNAWTAWTKPALYVQAFGPYAVLGYQQFIYGPFAAITTLFVSLVAFMQFLVGVLALKGSSLGPLGAMTFLIAITPLGVGAGFPGPPVLAYGMWRLYRGTSTRRGTGGTTTWQQTNISGADAASDVETTANTDIPARLLGLALTVWCWGWASTAHLSESWRTVLIWVTPLLTFPIARVGRKVLDSDPTPRRARSVTVRVHYAMMIALGSALFPVLRDLLNTPTISLPVLRQVVRMIVLLTGFATFLTVLNLALRGLGAPFAVKLSSRLATDWMYSWTRNPMLLCTLAWFFCLAIWHRSPWFIAFLVVSVTPGWIYFVKVYEERELEIRFGKAYQEYRARTSFLFPRLTRSAAERAGAHSG